VENLIKGLENEIISLQQRIEKLVSISDEIVEELQRQLAEDRESSAIKNKQIEMLKDLVEEAREEVVTLIKEKKEAEEASDRLSKVPEQSRWSSRGARTCSQLDSSL